MTAPIPSQMPPVIDLPNMDETEGPTQGRVPMNDLIHPAVDGEPLVNVTPIKANPAPGGYASAGSAPGYNIVFTVPGVDPAVAGALIIRMQKLLSELTKLSLTLKHAHWNVTGHAFIGVHKMLDKFVDQVRLDADTVAERIETLGGCAWGTLASVVKDVGAGEDYGLGRAPAMAHLHALNMAYTHAIMCNRKGIALTGAGDPVSQNMLQGIGERLEHHQWFIRAHLEQGVETLGPTQSQGQPG